MGEAAQEVKQGQGLFSREERRALVRSFIEYYLGGKIDITYWKPNTNVVSLSSGEKTTGLEKAQSKAAFLDLLEIVCNANSGTSSTGLQGAIDQIFNDLVTFRAGGFIEGEFPILPIWEPRLASLEARMSSIEKLFEELMQRLKVKE